LNMYTFLAWKLRTLPENLWIQTESLANFFCQYFGVVFINWIFSITNSVGIYRHKYFVGIHQGNPSQNTRN
jgi:hypothetical protein